MTSHDVRDVLNLPSDGSAPRPTKKQKLSAPRPNLKGLAREVQNLGGDNPISIVPEATLFKKRRFASRKPAAKWELRTFKNSARDDGSLLLQHWRRKTEGDPNADQQVNGDSEMVDGESAANQEEQLEDSAFAKYNAQVVVPQYNEDQYNSKLQSTDWTKDETDYLMDLVKSYDLRWPLIWDRYEFSPRGTDEDAANGDSTAVIPAPKSRTMEDLKARYYEVAAKMMDVQKPVQYMTRPEWDLHQMMVNFNPNQERLRKEFALNSLSRSKEEAREEESLLLEVKRILARSEKFNEERRELYSRLDFPHTDQDISSFKSSAGLQTLLQNLMNVDKSKKRKSLIGPDGVSPASGGPNAQPQSATSEVAPSRRESIAAAASSGHRESIGTEKATPVSNKKGTQQPERRKLTEQEEQIYGVSHHDRLGSGPTFRYEKVNKIFTHKSGQQQLRITNALNELDIGPRLTMPTAPVTAQYELLIQAVTALVDLRKVADKLDGEIKIEEQKKLERQKKARAALGLDGASDEPSKDQTVPDSQDSAKGDASGATSGEVGADSKQDDQEPEASEATAQPEANPDVTGGDEGAGEDAAPPVEVKVEEGVKEKTPRPGSSGAHKRSASVLSTTSDKSAKRQRK